MTVTSITQPGKITRAAPSIDLHGEATPLGRLGRETWKARELLVILARKDFHVRYRRAALGVLWALALPLLQSAVMAVIFARVGHIRHVGVNYAALVLTGMAPWTYFNMALSAGSTAVVDNTDLSSRVYFPRALLPMTQILTSLYGYVVTLAIVLGLCPLLHTPLTLNTLLVIPGTLLLVSLVCGFVLVFSALHVYFRDIRYLVTAALMLWMYVTPIIYTASDAPGKLRTIIDVNPMTGVVDLFHYATVGHVGSMSLPLAVTAVWTLVLLGAGVALHCRYNRVFADLL